MTLSLKRKLIALAILPLAIVILISKLTDYKERSGTSNWKSTTGIVLFSGVEESTVHLKNRQNSFSPRTRTNYLQRIEYSYRVNAVDYTSKNFNLTPESTNSKSAFFDGSRRSFSNREQAQKAASAHKTGSAVTVYYNPQKPEIAALQKTDMSLSSVFFALLFLAFALLLVLIAFDFIDPRNLPWRKKS